MEPKINTILRPKVVFRITGLSKSSIYRMIAAGKFPSQISLGAHAVGFHSEEIEDWMSTREKKHVNAVVVH